MDRINMLRESTYFVRPQQDPDRFKLYVVIMEGEKEEPNYFNSLK